jgi:hypothetical protein
MEVIVRRLLTATGVIAGVLFVAAPAQGFAHSTVHNPYLHAALDALTLLVVASPVLTGLLWGTQRRGLLLALVALVQLPVAVIATLPIGDPWLHLTASVTAVAITAATLVAVRRSSRKAAPAAIGQPS